MNSSIFLLSLIVLAGSLTIRAQNTGELLGAVTDATGAVVTGAKVTVTETATGLTRSVNTGSDGFYTVPSLRPTAYKITVESPGFRTSAQEGVTLQWPTRRPPSISKLELGAVTETIDVSASASQVDTVTGTIRQVVDTARILELPLNGRNAATLAYTVAGTVASADLEGADQGSGKTFPLAVTVSANGTRQNEMSFLFDGGNNMDSFSYINAPFPFPDAVQEFSVQTSNYGAEYGMSAGGVISVTTKSGTNQFHGDAFEFVRNGEINARNYFASAVDPLKRNQYGGTIGGPVVLPHYNGRDKTFFFFGYQGTADSRHNLGGLSTFVPTAANLQGDFSNALTVNPNNPLGKATVIKDPVTGQPFPGNLIPVSRMDPASLAFSKYYPVGSRQWHCLLVPSRFISRFNEEIVRMDRTIPSARKIA